MLFKKSIGTQLIIVGHYFLNCHSVIPAADLSEQVRNESSSLSLFPYPMNTAVSPGSLLLGTFHWRDICDAAPKIPYWWCRLREESGEEVLIG